MDPLTLALIGAVSAGATSGATDAAKTAIVDGYEALKALLKRKFGNHGDVADAIDKLQDQPESQARRSLLAEELTKVKAADDPELSFAAESLLALIRALPQGAQHLQQFAQGTGIAQAVSGSTATVTLTGGHSKMKKDED